jgi:hypothetical protein
LRAADLSLCGDEVGLGGCNGGLGDVDLHLVRLHVELHEQVALPDAIIVIDQDTRDLTGNTRRHERHIPIDVGIVCGHGLPRPDDPRHACYQRKKEAHTPNDPQPPPPHPVGHCGRRHWYRRRRLYGRVSTWRGCGCRC